MRKISANYNMYVKEGEPTTASKKEAVMNDYVTRQQNLAAHGLAAQRAQQAAELDAKMRDIAEQAYQAGGQHAHNAIMNELYAHNDAYNQNIADDRMLDRINYANANNAATHTIDTNTGEVSANVDNNSTQGNGLINALKHLIGN